MSLGPRLAPGRLASQRSKGNADRRSSGDSRRYQNRVLTLLIDRPRLWAHAGRVPQRAGQRAPRFQQVPAAVTFSNFAATRAGRCVTLHAAALVAWLIGMLVGTRISELTQTASALATRQQIDDWLLLSNPRESKIDSGGRLEDGQVESGTGDTEVSADVFNPVSRSAAPQTSYFYAATRRLPVFGVA